MSSKVRFYLQFIHPQVSHSMDKDIMGKGKDSSVFVSGFVYNISSFDAAKQYLGQADQHCKLCVNMIGCLYSTVQLIFPYTRLSQISKSQSYGQKAYHIEVPMEV